MLIERVHMSCRERVMNRDVGLSLELVSDSPEKTAPMVRNMVANVI